jgi:type II secretory pathway pseudopilin PulG
VSAEAIEMKKRKHGNAGFSLVEMLVGTILFTIVTGIAFSLLMSAQLRYQGESTLTEAFQQANVALDQIVRDVHSAGYPPANSFAASRALANPNLVALPFSWSPGYTNTPPTPCIVGGSCGAVPGGYDLILESDTDGNGVQWIRYSLQGTTLMRGTTSKQPFKDPVDSTTGWLVVYLENVMNGSLPIFSYVRDGGPTPQPCNGGATQTPSSIREVNISLMVRSLQPDPQTQQYRTITLNGRAMRINPSQ